MKLIISMFVTVLSCSLAFGISKVPECESKPELLGTGRSYPNLKSLPPMVLVGKTANYYVENKKTGFRIWGEQSFVKGTSRIVCATHGSSKTQSFSIYAPTLMDLTGEKTVGDSYWQFHMMDNGKQIGIWNQKSRVFSKNKDLENGLAQTGAQVQISQISHDEYELTLTRDSDNGTEVLSIRFDAVSKLP